MAIVPSIAMDIPKHYIDWQRDVHDEMIIVAQNIYNYSKSEKAAALDQILHNNNTLMAKMYLKSFAAIITLCFSIYFFIRYQRQSKSPFWKSIAIMAFLAAFSITIKLYSWTNFNGSKKITLLNLSTTDTSLSNVYNNYFKGKIVYVDFWGTTCYPCLEEFKNFTEPLKKKYANRSDIVYLYVCGGQRLIWKQQLQKFAISGNHIFLNAREYVQFYRKAIEGSKDTSVYMPRYLIINKQGIIAETNAYRPSEKDSVYKQLDKYLALN